MSNLALTLRDVTRNQSTLDITVKNTFLGSNYFQEAAALLNASGVAVIPKTGMLVSAATGAGSKVSPYVTNADADAIVGILIIDNLETDSLANAAELANVNYAISGNVNELFLVSSDGTAIDPDALVGATNKTLRHALQKLGFHLSAVVDNTKTDN